MTLDRHVPHAARPGLLRDGQPLGPWLGPASCRTWASGRCATTSAGLGRSIGKNDQQVTRDELVAHVAELTSILEVPLNVDSERLFPDDPGGIAETVRLLAEAGAAGCSIEDFRPIDAARSSRATRPPRRWPKRRRPVPSTASC